MNIRNSIRRELLPVISITICLMTFLFLLVSNVPTFAAYEEIYEKNSETPLSLGVMKENYLKFTDVGWIHINVLRMDTTNPYTHMEVITDDYVINGGTVEALADQSRGYIGAINGDFFTTQSHSVMGQIVRDGQIISSSDEESGFATFFEDNNGYQIDYLDNYDSYLINNRTGYQVPIFSKNKNYAGYDRTIYIDNQFDKLSIGNTYSGDIVEIVITDHIVSDIRINQAPIEMQDNQYVLISTGTNFEPLIKAFKIGDSVDYFEDSTLDKMKFAISGGDYIVKDGMTHIVNGYGINGRHPRTAVGFNEDQSEIILVTVDGRDRSYTGVTLTELANIMIELGATEALNLDGGGSTTMVHQSFGTNDLNLANKPSDGGQRHVYNALAFVNSAPTHYLAETKIVLENEMLIKNIPNKITLLGVDTNLNPYGIDQNNIKYEVEGVEGVFEEGQFTATTSGKGKIKATYNNIQTEMDIVVEDDIIRLSLDPDEIQVNFGTKVKLSPIIKTSTGESYTLDLEDVTIELPEVLGSIDDNGYFVAGMIRSEGIMKVSYEGLVTYVPITVGGSIKLLNDFETLNAHFTSYPASVNGSYEKVFNGYNSQGAGLLYYDFTKTDATRAAYVTFDEPIMIDEGSEKIGMYIYSGEKSDHWLRGTVEDEAGKTYNIDFYNNIDFIGWQFVEASLPQDVEGQLKINRIYVVEIDKSKKDKGAILIDNLQIFNPSGYSGEVPEDVHKEVLLEDLYIPEQQFWVYKYHGNSFVDPNGDTMSEGDDNFKILNIEKNNHSIRKTDFTQWQSIMEWKNLFANDKIVVTMSENDYFYDPLEKSLLLETLNDLEKIGNEVILITENADQSYWYQYKDIEVYCINDEEILNIALFEGQFVVELER